MPKQSSLHVFDFDDTLFETDNSVILEIPGRAPIKLNSHEFAQLEKYQQLPSKNITPEDYKNAFLNFEDFQSIKNPRPITKNLRIFGNILLHSPDNLFILTARGGGTNKADIKNLIDEYFAPILPETGFDIGRIITKTEQQHIKGDTAEKKKNTLIELKDYTGLEQVHFMDDSASNIEKAKEVPGVRARLVTKQDQKTAENNMPRENVPHRVDEIADAILERMKKSKKKMSEEKMYDIAYGTAWKTYYKENPKAKKDKKEASEEIDDIKIANFLDSLNLYKLADTIMPLK